MDEGLRVYGPMAIAFLETINNSQEVTKELLVAGMQLAKEMLPIAKEMLPKEMYKTGLKPLTDKDKNKKFEVYYVKDPNCGCFGIAEAFDDEKLSLEDRVFERKDFYQLERQASDCLWKKNLTIEEMKKFDQILDNPVLIFDAMPKNFRQTSLKKADREEIVAFTQIEDPSERKQATWQFFMRDDRHFKFLKMIFNNI